jgi:hypothetical protein
LHTFNEEEEKLDLEIAKLRARNKSMQREKESLDEIQSKYEDLLLSLDPVIKVY